MTYVLDTNIITVILKENEKVKERILKYMLEGKKISINPVSYYEIKRGLLYINSLTQLKKLDVLRRKFGVISLDSLGIFDRAAEIYADLRRRGELIEDADILIASVVSFRNFILVSNDTDFNRIQELKVENWLN